MAIFSPAKINLFLHITGKRDDGYHLLDSLIAFTDIGDTIEITPAERFSFEITGPYAGHFSEAERKATPDSSNLVVTTAWRLAHKLNQTLNVSITLTKNLPLAAGIGGGSSNAASVIWGLLRHWNVTKTQKELMEFMLETGADVPVCYACETVRITDIGVPEEPHIYIPETPIILINPGIPTYTADIFKKFRGLYRERQDLPNDFLSPEALISSLKSTQNMLSDAAIETTPDIANVLNALERQYGCALARMSGSGATCFGLFTDENAMQDATEKISTQNPDWWVKAGWLGRSGRY